MTSEMYGEPKDVPGECNARLCIGDNFGDNHATMRCQKAPGHEGKHREVYKDKTCGEVVVEWDHDDKLAHDLRSQLADPVAVEEPVIGDDD